MFEDWEREFCWLSHWLLWRHVFGFFFYFSDTFCFLFERQGRQREREWMSEWEKQGQTNCQPIDPLPKHLQQARCLRSNPSAQTHSRCLVSAAVTQLLEASPLIPSIHICRWFKSKHHQECNSCTQWCLYDCGKSLP